MGLGFCQYWRVIQGIALLINAVLFYFVHVTQSCIFWFFWFYHVWIKTLPWYLMALVTSKHSMIILEKGGRGLLVHVVWLWFISSLFLCRFHRHVWRRAGSVPAARTSIWWVSITTTVARYLYRCLYMVTTILYL